MGGDLPAEERNGLLGRTELLAGIERRLATGGGVVLAGPDGIGKSALLDVVAATAAERGELVLRLSPAEPERSLLYSGLVDLFTQLPPDAVEALSAPYRAVVEAVLSGSLGSEGEGGLACRRALCRVLETVAARQPVLLVLDDTQWLDAASAGMIGYVVRRTGDQPIRTVAARRLVEPGSDHWASRLCPPPVLELTVPPLAADDLAALLEAHGLPCRAASRLHADSGGNPYLALALGGAFGPDPEPAWRPVPLPEPVRTRLRRRIDALPTGVAETLLVAALATRPTVTQLCLAGRPDAEREIRLAGSAGLVRLDGPVVCFTPAGVATVLVDEAESTRRAAIHAALAGVATDRAEDARHRALAGSGPDAEVTRSLVAAAEAALRRGARGLVAELYLLAADRTPPGWPRQEWLVSAAEAAASAGQPDLAGRAAEAVLAGDATAAHRVRARIALIDLAGQALGEMDQAFAAALADAESEVALLGPLRLRLAWRALVAGTPDRAVAEIDGAITAARAAGDRTTEAMALGVRAQVQRVRGHADYVDTLARALALPVPELTGWLHLTPRYLAARFALADDRLDAARAELLTMLATAERGGGEELIGVLRSLAEVSARSGRCREALQHAQRAMRVCEQTRGSPGPCWYTLAVAELAGGSVTRALAYAERGVRASEQERDSIFLCRNLHVLGQARLRAGQHRAGVDALRRLRDLEAEQGVADPSLLRWHGDLAAGLAALGAYDEATETIAMGRRAALRLGHCPGVLAQLDRAAALVLAERGDPGSAVDLSAAAAQCFATLDQPIERGHALLVQGGAERRRRRYAAARVAVGAALTIFLQVEAKPWVEQTNRVLARAEGISTGPYSPDAASRTTDRPRTVTGVTAETGDRPPAGPPGAPEGLTSTEAHIAGLVRQGASNREIATRLFISVKTVEATLTRVYRKLGVRSRTQLSSRLNER
ncbi:AAA family ATPase [Micromonospora sp. NBC_01699]|uniref:AAA family ATPase n=1 Tax=Micromonospora sp. NBC_01699 TaxID=2975984 RepID=UPI002E35EA8A|nr:AAA family ATPase [Micromonospora sp. NBC_01699]